MDHRETANLQRLASRAKEISEDADFKAILRGLKEGVILEWANTASDQQDRREELYRAIHAIGQLEHKLGGLEGELAVELKKQEAEERRGARRERQQQFERDH